MRKAKRFESKEEKLKRLKEEHLHQCETLDYKLNQLELKYNNRRPDIDGLVKGDESDVDAVLMMMAGIMEKHQEIQIEENS